LCGPPVGAHYVKSERNPISLFPLFCLMSPHGARWDKKRELLSTCSDLG